MDSVAGVDVVRPASEKAGTTDVVVQATFDDARLDFETESVYESPLQPMQFSSLQELEQLALDQNPTLVRLYREYLAASSRSQYVDKLPDPNVGANVFIEPIETAAGSQRANISVSQMIPWLGKLSAEEQRACFEALAISADYRAERLRILAGIRTGWYRLYVIDKQIETTNANQLLLESLIDVANAKVATGTASQGDVLLGTLELSRLEERLLTYRRQRVAVEAEVNRLVAQSAGTQIIVPETISVQPPQWDATEIYQIALQSQPDFQAAQLRTQATRWGIEVARLSRRPSVTLSANYFPTDDNRPISPFVNVGENPWSLGVHMSIPIGNEKYSAMQDEATWKHFASHDSLQALYDKYDALIVDLLTEARRAEETATLYQQTILPQARQTLEADQESYSNGTVEFDRVVQDYRNLLTLELGYHQSIGDMAVMIAQIRRAAGQDIPNSGAAIPPMPSE
ncbi:TolC family protein [Symmachiella dynata]|uniref:TolC family protein n=1 Tax=Symmachiella dynata TaxID=2527995 RepID=UPI0018D44669|nr:TolC family protein [Symmachiella dynata]